MRIRNPFKDKWGNFKDDVTPKEKNIWIFGSVIFGMVTVRLLDHWGFIDWIKELISP